MNTNFPVNWRIQELPITGFTLGNLYSAMVANLKGTIDETVLPAVPGPQQTTSVRYPVFDGAGWNTWSSSLSAYTPIPVIAGSVKLSASPTAGRLQTLQNKTGTIALLDDAYGVRDTTFLKEGNVLIDWDKGSNFVVVLSANRQISIYLTHARPGMQVKVLIVNNGTKQTIGAWDSSIKWPSATIPTMPAASPGSAASLLVTLRKVGTNIYAEYQTQNHVPVEDRSEPSGLISL